jgi:hypothetical protein
MSKDLFKEAIADAKAVREAALANAKAALEESMTPKLQSMIAAKLAESEELEENYQDEEMEEGFGTNQFMWGDEDNSETDQNKFDEGQDSELEEDFDLSEILAELSEDEANLAEAKDEDKVDEAKKKDKEEKGEDKKEEKEAKTVDQLEVDDLKDIIRDIIAQELAAIEAPAGEEMGGEEMGNEMSTDEVGDEIPAEDMGMEAPAGEEMPNLSGEEKKEEEEINLEELLAELDALEEKKGAAAPAKEKEKEKEKTKKPSTRPDTTPAKMEESKEQELEEALKAVNTLKAELNEVNLLNAKLIYVNKIFKAKNLTESQKLNILASFDKATTIKEAQMVFESLSTTLNSAPKKTAIKESLGFASKAAGVAPTKKMIVESDDVISRMQKLANIK